MTLRRLLIANRGEIALRIVRSATELGIACVAMHPKDDRGCAHVRACTSAVELPGSGARAYLDVAAVVRAARKAGCDAVHPGYGFLSERADFAAACAAAGLVFVGPSPAVLALFGDKARALDLAHRLGVPTAGGTGETDLAGALAFQAAHGAVMVKALAGGGGRGMRVAADAEALRAAWDACAAEAQGAFGSGALYVERLVARARHVEVQVIGDGAAAMTLGERECSLQRRRQKLVEIAPAPHLDPALRERLFAWSLSLARDEPYRGLATFEFLADLDRPGEAVFIEANPRLQVEHTVTEAVTGLDLVALQLRLAGGETLAELGLDPAAPPAARGCAIQLRISAEETGPDGEARPAGGVITAFAPPGGPGVRVDAGVGVGDTLNPAFDPLIAKLIVHAADAPAAVRRAGRALAEFNITGAPTNAPLLAALLALPEVLSGAADTGLVERRLAEIAPAPAAAAPVARATPEGAVAVAAPLAGLVASLEVAVGEAVWPGRVVAVLEALKMEHVVRAEAGGVVRALAAAPGAAVIAGAPLLFLDPAEIAAPDACDEVEIDLDDARPDLAAFRTRLALTEDAARPDAVARRHARGGRTARENVADLVDAGSFVEYGALAVAAQRRRRPEDDLRANTPHDGIVTGFGAVNGALFDPPAARTAVLAYDYTVLAGTQGYFGHRKTDRVLEEAHAWKTPVVFYCEGGGGRPGDTDPPGVAGLDTRSFGALARLSGAQALVGIANGRCFAGNAAMLGCCDVVIATEGSNIGMGGPAMIEGGGLGVFTPEEVGPLDVQVANGVVDIAVADEAEATAAARRYLGYFQGATGDWTADDPRRLRRLVPENRLRVYDMRAVMAGLFDAGSVLELRHAFGRAVVTALARIEGRPVGVLANDPAHLSGAIDGDAADKGARFLRLCEAHGLPVVSLVDTPGFMVGPDVEATAQVRRACRLFVAGAALTVPFLAVVVRKGYGLGAQAMAAGGFAAPAMIVAWPTGEFGGMGLEGAVKLGYRRELEALADPGAREAHYRELVARQYARGSALNMAQALEIDAVIDPADTRALLVRHLAGLPRRRSDRARHAFIDTW